MMRCISPNRYLTTGTVLQHSLSFKVVEYVITLDYPADLRTPFILISLGQMRAPSSGQLSI